MAVIQAKNGLKATVLLRQAAEAFLSQSGNERTDHFVPIDFTKGTLALQDAMAYYYQDDYAQAMDSFSQFINLDTLALKTTLPERSRIEGLNILTMALLKQPHKDMERTIHCWRAAMQGAQTLQSEQRFHEAFVSYEAMQSVWSGEKRLSALRDLAVHW